MLFIVTIKLPKNPDHNPHKKVTGPCPVDMPHRALRLCTDVTGEHHTVTYGAEDVEAIKILFSGFHITRIEEA